jgi:hypothetical protein
MPSCLRLYEILILEKKRKCSKVGIFEFYSNDFMMDFYEQSTIEVARMIKHNLVLFDLLIKKKTEEKKKVLFSFYEQSN